MLIHYRADELALSIDPTYLARGRGYQRQGRVLRAEWKGERQLHATVIGSTGGPYTCKVDVGRGGDGRLRINGECDCPIGYNCKHVAAALLEAALRKPAPAPAAPTTATPAATAPAIDSRMQQWLRDLQNAQSDQDAYPPEMNERLLYVLDLRSHPTAADRLVVTPLKTRLLKNGSYGSANRYSSYGGAYFLRPTDVRLLAQLNTQLQFGGELRLEQEDGARLLKTMLATGRCHWQSKDSPPLSLAAARPGEFVWDRDEDGAQRLGLRIAAPALALPLPLTPPWYLDPEQACCGPIETALPDRLAAALTRAPVLDPEAADEVGEQLLRLAPALPLPSRQQRRHRDDVVPRPTLRLHSVSMADFMRRRLGLPANYAAALPQVYQEVAEPGFDYEDFQVAAKDPAELVIGRRGEVLWTISRDRPAERRAAERLVELGFHSGEHGLSLADDSAWVQFLLHELPTLRAEGWRIDIDPDFRVALAEAGDWFGELDEHDSDWFGLSLGVNVDGQRINLLPLLSELLRRLPRLADLEALADDATLTVRLEDQRLLPLPVSRLRPILRTLLELYDPKALDSDGRLRLSRLNSPLLSDLEQSGPLAWSGGESMRRLGERLQSFRGIAAAVPPRGLRAELRGYQAEGLAWLQFLREYGLAGVLADDMGLGKTVQTLAHLLTEKEAGRADRPSLVVVPTSLLSNWRREAERFAPALSILILHGPRRENDFPAIDRHDLVLTTYPLLARDADVLTEHEYHLLILDEAQQIKNPRAKAAEAARQLRARHRLCLTGTPLENHLGELWSLFHFLMPGLLGDRERFTRQFRTPIEKLADPQRQQQLQRRIAPFLLRRTKEAVAAELPAKTEVVRSVALEGAQRDLYETVRVALHERIRSEIDGKGWERSQIVVLDALLKLRQVCCDPRLVKLEAARRVKQSAKLELLLDMLPELISEGRRILLFSQFTGMLSLIEESLLSLKIDYVKLTGQTRDRSTPIDRFQNGEVPLFLISLKAGGVGLNLTAADTVIHYDPWWNPAVERQATDRAHRIGQDKPVFVYKLIAEGTVEEKMAELQARKQALSDAVLTGGGTVAARLSAEDLEAMLAPL